MQNAPDYFNQRLWIALGRLIEHRYQRNIRFLPAVMAEAVNEEFTLTKNGDVVIPLRSGVEYLGALRIKQGGSLHEEQVQEIRQMLHKIEVILLEVRESRTFLKEEGSAKGRISEKKQKIQLIGGSLEERKKLAMDLHTQLRTTSFISWGDLRPQESVVSEWHDLQDTIIYVPEVNDLSPLELQNLWELVSMPEESGPHMIIGTLRVGGGESSLGSIFDKIQREFQNSLIFVDQMPKEYLLLKEVLAMLLSRSEDVSATQSEGTLLYI